MALTEVITPTSIPPERDPRDLRDGCTAAIEATGLPAYVTGVARRVPSSTAPRRWENRDSLHIDERVTYLAWLVQQNRGVFEVAVVQAGDLDDGHHAHGGGRSPLRRELRGARDDADSQQNLTTGAAPAVACERARPSADQISRRSHDEYDRARDIDLELVDRL